MDEGGVSGLLMGDRSLGFRLYEVKFSECLIFSFAISRATTSYTSRSGSKKKGRSQKKEYSSEDESSIVSGSEPNFIVDDDSASQARNLNDNARKNMGLDWMLRPKSSMGNTSVEAPCLEPEEIPTKQSKKDMSRELNPYFKDDGSSYPEESNVINNRSKQLLSNVVVGDGGASWRLKALKRAKEQARMEFSGSG